MTVCDLFLKNACRTPDAVAVHCKGVDYSYAELDASSADMARSLLASGVLPGDRVLLVVRNSAEFVVSYLAIWRAAGVVVALNPQVTTEEFQAIARDCQPTVMILEPHRVRELAAAAGVHSVKHVVTFAEKDNIKIVPPGDPADRAELPLNLPQVQPEQLAQIIYTSGTTGRPKGVVLSHGNVAANCQSIISYLKLTPQDRVLVVLPFFYSYGNSLLFTHLACGGKLVLATDTVFWSRVTQLMSDQSVTGFAGVPSTYSLLVHKSDFCSRQFPALRYVTCAGGRLAPDQVSQVRAVVPHADLFLMYGQTEATARLSTVYPHELPAKVGTIGKGIPGVTLRVLDENAVETPAGVVGEVVAQGPNIMQGYWNDPELTNRVLRPEGLRTGDLAYRDEDGYIVVVGRQDDMIKSGGHRIFPGEIEDVIRQVPDVVEVAVIGAPDPLLYERPVAVVVSSAPAGSASQEEPILSRCLQLLPPHKRPCQIQFVDALPKTASGKVKRSSLKMALIAASPPNA